MNIEASMVGYYADRAKEYERIYDKPERQDNLRRLRNFVATAFLGEHVYVETSSTPIHRADEHGDTYQIRRLNDGSAHEVLKNVPSESELRAAVEDYAVDLRVEFLRYYWILSYVTRTDA